MATNSPIITHPIDTTKPSVNTVPIATSLFTAERLDKNKSNWQEWSRDLEECLSMSQGLDGHLDGSSECPNMLLEPCAYRNWKINDKVIRAFMSNKSARAEHDFIDGKEITTLPNKHGKPSRNVMRFKDQSNKSF